MKKAQRLLIIFLVIATVGIKAQVGMGTINPPISVPLDVSSSNQNVRIARDPNPRKDMANVFYKSEYTLFDLYTDEPIFPDAYGYYEIYYASNENKKPVYLKVHYNNLNNYRVYKFKNYDNCNNWCKGIPAIPYNKNNIEITSNNNPINAKLDNNVTGLNPSNKTNYSTILINGREWMTQNLDLIIFRNGDIIPQAKTELDLINANKNQSPVWCYFDFNPATETNFGKLYNWYALNDPRGLLPIGFVTPSIQDWQSLNNYNYFKNSNGRAQAYISETKEMRGGKINKSFIFSFENGPFKVKKYDRVFGVPEDEIGFYWTTGIYQDQYNDRINVYGISSRGSISIDLYEHKGACVSVRGVKGDHNYYVGNWIGKSKSGNGIEFYGTNTELKGFGIVHKGDKYSGNWINGVQEGEGSIIYNNGQIKTGLWRNGEFKGEWRLIDNRHKCYQCNIKICKAVKRTASEIVNFKKDAFSNEIGLYNTQSYCSSTCENKAIAIQKAWEKQYARKVQNNLSKQQITNSTSSNHRVCSHCNGSGRCSNCNRTFTVHYWESRTHEWKDRNETRPGQIMCSDCRGAGVIYGVFGNANDPESKPCYVNRCKGGWHTCGDCNPSGNGDNRIGQCWYCLGKGY